jgi:hypothetical protein
MAINSVTPVNFDNSMHLFQCVFVCVFEGKPSTKQRNGKEKLGRKALTKISEQKTNPDSLKNQ